MMDWLRENFFWLVVGALFVWMHLKMHGGHGHGGHTHREAGGGRGAPGDDAAAANGNGGHHAEH